MQDNYNAKMAVYDSLVSRPNTADIPDLADYTAWTSFAPVVTFAKTRLYARYKTSDARAAHLTLEAIAECANNLGVSFRLSQRTVEERAHLRRDNVQRGMMILIDEDYVRQHVTNLPSRRTPFVEWQINPYVLHIGRGDVFDAFQLWRNTHQIDSACIFIHTESRIRESRPKTQTEYPDKGTRPALKGKGAGVVDNWVETDIEQCRKALDNWVDEAAANNIATLCKMHLTQARQLIQTYGRARVDTAYLQLAERQRTENIYKPGGALRAMLRREHGRRAEPPAQAGGD